MGQIYKTSTTITFVNTKDKLLTGYEFPEKIKVQGVEVELNNKVVNWILNNNHKSKHSDERFIYNQSLINFYEVNKDEDKTVYDKIRSWARERGIYDFGDPLTQYCKLMEEAGELAEALVKEKYEKKKIDTIDAIGDMVVVLTNLAELVGVKIEDCVDSAYSEIANRKGKMENGTFVKEK